MPKINTIASVIPKYITVEGGCWIWNGKIGHNGYGHVTVNYRSKLVHRFFYEELRGPIPVGLQIDHLCDTRACANPSHMKVVTAKENQARTYSCTAINARKTHCPSNHPLSGANLYICPRGRRNCRECRRSDVLRHYAKFGRN